MAESMIALLVVGVAAILVVGIVISLDLGGRHSRPLDTERTEQWFVRHAPSPLRRLLRFADRRLVGGAALVFTFMVVLLTAIMVGWVLDTVDESRGFARWDESAAEYGAGHSTTTSTHALELITQLGATGWLLGVMGAVGVVMWVRHRRPDALGYLAAVGLGVSALNNALKHLVQRERPSVLQLTSQSGYSFPSGHTAAAAACSAAILLVIVRRRSRAIRTVAAVLAMVITLAVATSRVLLGVHWLTDVIAGALVGWAWFVMVTVLFGGRLLRFGEPLERIDNSIAKPLDTDVDRVVADEDSPGSPASVDDSAGHSDTAPGIQATANAYPIHNAKRTEILP